MQDSGITSFALRTAFALRTMFALRRIYFIDKEDKWPSVASIASVIAAEVQLSSVVAFFLSVLVRIVCIAAITDAHFNQVLASLKVLIYPYLFHCQGG
jgi:hypothetical protein